MPVALIAAGPRRMFWSIAFCIALFAIACRAMTALLAREIKESRHHADAIEQYAQWVCPNCGERLGNDATIVEYEKNSVARALDLNGRPFVRAVVISCSGCRHLNVYDAAGRAGYGRGVYFDPTESHQEEERWQRMALELTCLKCDHRGMGWSGRVWTNPNWPLDKSAPIMCCANCGAETMVEPASG